MTHDEIFDRVKEILVSSFELELEASKITEATTLYEALGLDSVDALTIFVQIRHITQRRPDPAEARTVRTVGELVEFVERELAKGPQEDDEEELFVFARPTAPTEDDV